MNPIFTAALEVQSVCAARGWKFSFIGAVAVLRWGEPRLTLDVDLTVLTGFGSEEPFIDALLGAFPGRRPDAADFALAHRVLLLQATNGVPIDVALGAMPFEERAVSRSTPFSIGAGDLRTISAEDLIVMKAFASREKDWLDIRGVAIRQRGKLDERQVWLELRPLLDLKESPETAERLEALLRQARG